MYLLAVALVGVLYWRYWLVGVHIGVIGWWVSFIYLGLGPAKLGNIVWGEKLKTYGVRVRKPTKKQLQALFSPT